MAIDAQDAVEVEENAPPTEAVVSSVGRQSRRAAERRGARQRMLWAAGWAARLIVAGVFGVAAALKIAGPEAFALAISRYQLVGFAWSAVAAIILPWVELVAAVALLLPGAWRRAAGGILAVLLVVFTAAVASAWWRGLNINCGCFSSGAEATPIGWWSFVRNGLLLGLTVLAAWPLDRGEAAAPKRSP